MSHPVVEDPSGHAHPLRLSSLSSAVFLDPKRRRMVKAATAFMGLLCACLVAMALQIPSSFSLSSWATYLSVLLAPVFWALWWIYFVKTSEWSNHRLFPNEFRLAKDTRGLDLLRDGEELVRRRERLDCDQKSDHPLMSHAEALYAWKEQGRLERELRAQQDALLRELDPT